MLRKIIAVGICTALLLPFSGCSPKPLPGVQALDKLSPPATGGITEHHGTVDGGGGAGFRGEPLEKYHKVITKLPEFNNRVLPVLDAIGKLNPEFEKIFMHIVKDRLWLFMNAPVPKIPESRQGTPYNIDQWAVQDSKEIWFSDQYQGDEDARAAILLHEILVGIKILRFLSYNEYCYAFTSDPANCDLTDNDALIENYKLTDLDHEDARGMGDWLWDNYTTMTAQDFGLQMDIHQMQGPHYGWKAISPEQITTQRVMNPTVDKLAGTTVSLYTGYDMDHIATEKCEVKFFAMHDKHLPVEVRITKLKNQSKDRTLKFNLAYDPGHEIKVAQVMDAYENYFTVWLDQAKAPRKVGEHQQFLTLNFDEELMTEASGGQQIVDRLDKDGLPEAISSSDPPNGFYCTPEPVERPLNFGIWLTMRPNDREFLERNYYGGKTLKALLQEVLQRPEFTKK